MGPASELEMWAHHVGPLGANVVLELRGERARLWIRKGGEEEGGSEEKGGSSGGRGAAPRRTSRRRERGGWSQERPERAGPRGRCEGDGRGRPRPLTLGIWRPPVEVVSSEATSTLGLEVGDSFGEAKRV